MAELYTQLIASMTAGVSQQSDGQRDPSQGEVQLNAVSSVTEGLRKREGSQLLAKISDAPLGDVLVHPILRDADEKYLALIYMDKVQVFDLQGDERGVYAPNGFEYLKNVTSPRESIRAVSLGDFTWISNMQVAPRMSSRLSPEKPRPFPHEALVWIKAANFGQQYTLVVNGREATVTTPVAPVISKETNGSIDVIENRVSGEQILSTLLNNLNLGASGVTWVQSGSVAWLRSANPITIGARDAQGGVDISVITSAVQSFTDLPARAPAGYQVTIEGRSGTDVDDYYVEFRVRDGQGDFGEGSWIETVAPGCEYKADENTMPHVLVRLQDNSFFFGPMDGKTYTNITSPVPVQVTLPTWGRRTAGDYDSAPDPSFIGKPINDVFIYRNRLGFLADEAVILSRPGEFFEFFPETVTTTTDGDPIDLLASGTRVSVLRYAVPAQNELVLFSDQTQFRLETQAATLTAATTSINVLTQYEIDIRCRPVQVGGSIVFAQANGEWTRFQEMKLRGNGASVVADVDDVTQQIPSYIPAGAFVITAEAASGSWYTITDSPEGRNSIYTNKYFWRNNGDGIVRMQNAWSQWTISGADQIRYILAIQEVLYLVTEAGGRSWMERMPITDPSPKARLLPMELLMDRWLYCRPAQSPRRSSWHELALPRSLGVAGPIYEAENDVTEWVLPFDVPGPMEVWTGLEGELGFHHLGTITSGRRFRTEGNWSHAQVVFGNPYEFRYRFTRFKPYRQEPTARVALNATRTQVRQAKLRYHDTQFFQVRVLAEGRPEARYTFDAMQSGTRNNRIGKEKWNYQRDEEEQRYREGVFSIPVLARGDTAVVELFSDRPLPCKFSSCEVVGLLFGKARR